MGGEKAWQFVNRCGVLAAIPPLDRAAIHARMTIEVLWRRRGSHKPETPAKAARKKESNHYPQKESFSRRMYDENAAS
jgi:hypothetical protein